MMIPADNNTLENLLEHLVASNDDDDDGGVGLLLPALPGVNVDLVVAKYRTNMGNDSSAASSSSSSIDTTELAATCAFLTTTHPDYGALAGRIVAYDIQTRHAPASFSQAMREASAENALRPDFLALVAEHASVYDGMVRPERDYAHTYFSLRTLCNKYLMHSGTATHPHQRHRIYETPQYMWMRVAVELHRTNFAAVRETYDYLSLLRMTHATPTLFNAGLQRNQMASCFLTPIKEDSIEGIYDTLKNCALISKHAGGIGLSVSNVRAAKSRINGSNGESAGLLPIARQFNELARYVMQGDGRRRASIAVYIEPWHADVEQILDLRKNTGKEELRARDLFTALWIPDLFMRRVERDEHWTLFSPDEAPGLVDVWGDAFDALYEHYEADPARYPPRRRMKARDLWFRIVEAQIETGTPYMLYKDACNRASNQQNLGTIRSSNLCCEIVEYSSPDETAVCNLGSLCLPKYAVLHHDSPPTFDFEALHAATKVLTRNLNRVIDITTYPVEEARRSNQRHRPIGIGVQGLADLFCVLRLQSFACEEARRLNLQIFETIYHAALEASCDLASSCEDGGTPYETFAGSPASRGLLQFDMWPAKVVAARKAHFRYSDDEWQRMRERIMRHGLRNSLLVAPMPTASTAQIMGNNESFEPYTSNIYVRRVLAGEFVVLNEHLVRELIDLDCWTSDIRNAIIANKGSVQPLVGAGLLPREIGERYRTVWEISQRDLIDMAVDRGLFVCQSQSFNVHLSAPTFQTMTSMHFYGWRSGLKTGQYYLRTRPAVDPIAFTVDVQKAQQVVSSKKRKKEETSARAIYEKEIRPALLMINNNSDAENYDENHPCESCMG